MARTIAEIKSEMGAHFIAEPTVQELYGIKENEEFEHVFSKVSLESIFFFIVASTIWVLEMLFDRHKLEVEEIISEKKPHTLRWYARKALAFQYGGSVLQTDSDEYDNTGKSAAQIEQEMVVKYAAVVEKSAIVYVKVATGAEGDRKPLSVDQETALRAYFKEVKDAGVKLEVMNREPNLFGIKLDVYYDPQIFRSDLSRLDSGVRTVHKTIADFVENLPFNGEYRNSALIAELLKIEGVVVAELHSTTCDGQLIDAKIVPESGYFKMEVSDKLEINPIPYETVSI